MQANNNPPVIPTGKFKSFGELGPKYEVGSVVRQIEDNDWLVEITLIETGEKAEIKLSQINSAPEAA